MKKEYNITIKILPHKNFAAYPVYLGIATVDLGVVKINYSIYHKYVPRDNGSCRDDMDLCSQASSQQGEEHGLIPTAQFTDQDWQEIDEQIKSKYEIEFKRTLSENQKYIREQQEMKTLKSFLIKSFQESLEKMNVYDLRSERNMFSRDTIK